MNGRGAAAPAGRFPPGRLLDGLLLGWVLLVFALYAWRFAGDWLAANLGRVAGLL